MIVKAYKESHNDTQQKFYRKKNQQTLLKTYLPFSNTKTDMVDSTELPQSMSIDLQMAMFHVSLQKLKLEDWLTQAKSAN